MTEAVHIGLFRSSEFALRHICILVAAKAVKVIPIEYKLANRTIQSLMFHQATVPSTPFKPAESQYTRCDSG